VIPKFDLSTGNLSKPFILFKYLIYFISFQTIGVSVIFKFLLQTFVEIERPTP